MADSHAPLIAGNVLTLPELRHLRRVSGLRGAGLVLHAWAMIIYLLLWLVPLATWYQVVTRVRDIAEHALASEDHDPLRNTRRVLAGFLARTFVAPYWVNYHLEHHLLVFVPCWKLRETHALLVAKGYRPRMEVAPSYAAVIRRATSSVAAPRSGSRSGTRPA